MNILHIDASMRSQDSVTRSLTAQVVKKLGNDHHVIYRDLRLATIPHVSEDWLGANFTPAEQRTYEQQQVLALSDQLIDELQISDVLVFGVPVYNFGIPSALKAWVDQVCRAGITFKYTEQGPVGLLEGKQAIVVIASGGTRVNSEIDFATPYMRQMLGFIGIQEVKFVTADSLMADPQRLEKAQQQLAALPELMAA